MNIFFFRPTTRNIGNDIIGYATAELLYEVFGTATNIVSVPALKGLQFGGLTARQIYDVNRLADAVVLGGGNLFENGQITYDAQAVDAMCRPMMLMALSHGRVYGRDGYLEKRTDALSPAAIRHLVQRAAVSMVRDKASQKILGDLGAEVVVGGCPTLFLPPNGADREPTGEVIISVRHPFRMSVAPEVQWRIADDVRRLIAALKAEFSQPVRLACHDYIDLEFAAGFPNATPIYFDDVGRYISALRSCVLHVSYRLNRRERCGFRHRFHRNGLLCQGRLGRLHGRLNRFKSLSRNIQNDDQAHNCQRQQHPHIFIFHKLFHLVVCVYVSQWLAAFSLPR